MGGGGLVGGPLGLIPDCCWFSQGSKISKTVCVFLPCYSIHSLAHSHTCSLSFDVTGEEEHDLKLKKSVCLSYTVLLLLLIIRHSEKVEMLEKYSKELLHFSEQGEETGTKSWFSGLCALSFSNTPSNVDRNCQLYFYFK